MENVLIYVFTKIFLYQNITTNKGKNLSWIKLFSEVHYALYIYHAFAQISLITMTSFTQNTPILMAIKIKIFCCVVLFSFIFPLNIDCG